MHFPYTHAAVGGTFDHLHEGHKTLLQIACTKASHITVGLSLPTLYQQKVFSKIVEPFVVREKNLKQFFRQQGWLGKVTILPLSDSYGTTLTDATFDLIVVSEETKATAEHINTLRRQNNLPALTIFTIPFVTGEDKKPISAERIRSGEIDQNGRSYPLFFTKRHEYHLPHHLRSQLRKPLGTLLTKNDLGSFKQESPFLTAVGDITTLSLLQEGITPAIAFIDGKTQRRMLSTDIAALTSWQMHALINTAGTISPKAAASYQTALQSYLSTHQPQLIYVTGEEDLLALVAMLLSPLSSYVIYGQQDKGMIALFITPEQKNYAKSLLSQFHAQV